MFKSDLTRSQQLNLADCLEKIRKSIYNAATVPQQSPDTPEKIRRRLIFFCFILTYFIIIIIILGRKGLLDCDWQKKE